MDATRRRRQRSAVHQLWYGVFRTARQSFRFGFIGGSRSEISEASMRRVRTASDVSQEARTADGHTEALGQ